MAHVRKLEKDIRCPLEYGSDMLGGRWKSRAICILAAQQPLRYGKLRDEMVNISDTMLASKLIVVIVSHVNAWVS